MLKIIFYLILFITLLPTSAMAISAESAVLLDAASKRVLFGHNIDKKMPMASTTKIMTALLSCESGKLDENVRISLFAASTEGSSIWLRAGEVHSLENLTYGLMLNSGNDAAVSIAEFMGGNVNAFSLMMNAKAEEIGLKNTHFINPHGLYDENHYTTAFDLALIAQQAMKNDDFRKIVSSKNYKIPSYENNHFRYLKNHNKLLWQYEGCTGIKTGYTKKSGRCLVTSAIRDGRELICVTLNAPDDWKDHTELLNYGFMNFDTEIITEKMKEACEYTVENANEKTVKLLYSDDFIISKQPGDVIKTEISYNKISLPLKKGEVAGVLSIWCNEEKIGEIKLVTDRNINKLSFFKRLKNRLKTIRLFGFWFGNQ